MNQDNDKTSLSSIARELQNDEGPALSLESTNADAPLLDIDTDDDLSALSIAEQTTSAPLFSVADFVKEVELGENPFKVQAAAMTPPGLSDGSNSFPDSQFTAPSPSIEPSREINANSVPFEDQFPLVTESAVKVIQQAELSTAELDTSISDSMINTLSAKSTDTVGPEAVITESAIDTTKAVELSITEDPDADAIEQLARELEEKRRFNGSTNRTFLSAEEEAARISRAENRVMMPAIEAPRRGKHESRKTDAKSQNSLIPQVSTKDSFKTSKTSNEKSTRFGAIFVSFLVVANFTLLGLLVYGHRDQMISDVGGLFAAPVGVNTKSDGASVSENQASGDVVTAPAVADVTPEQTESSVQSGIAEITSIDEVDNLGADVDTSLPVRAMVPPIPKEIVPPSIGQAQVKQEPPLSSIPATPSPGNQGPTIPTQADKYSLDSKTPVSPSPSDPRQQTDRPSISSSPLPAQAAPLVQQKTAIASSRKETPSAAPPDAKVCLRFKEVPAKLMETFQSFASQTSSTIKDSRLVKIPSGYIVYLPASLSGNDAQIKDLTSKGLRDTFRIRDNSEINGALSLGLFKTEAAANKQRSILEKNGVSGMQVAPRSYRDTFVFVLETKRSNELKAIRISPSHLNAKLDPC